ncbi:MULTISPECIES: UPF0158 family protein [unclassified Carboxylicivirga]|uniref:UPF0158 family protein n=1 Tax=Carboxylicivirga TaxID=1628153 RepID=UPI003D335D88
MRNTSELIERVMALMADEFMVYIQRSNSRIVALPSGLETTDFMDLTDDYDLLMEEVEQNPNDYYQVEPLSSREIYNLMMDFSLEQERVDSLCLVKALRTKEPLNNFKVALKTLGPVMESSWQTYYSDRLRRILRSRFCKEHIHVMNENCNEDNV